MAYTRSMIMQDNFKTCLLNEKFVEIPISLNRKHINFAIIKLKNNFFDEKQLKDFLKNASITYALPRERVKLLQDQGKLVTLIDEAKAKFRISKVNEGEGGELIAYCINEDILNAPKILSKMKLKTNNNDYVKGADGLHILQKGENEYEIILCESKMYENLEDAIDQAFKSIDRFIDGEDLDFEISTLATNLAGEFETIDVDKIITNILPQKDGVRSNDAFSIFIGFQVSSDIDRSLDYKEYEEKLIKQIELEIKRHKRKLFNKLSEEKRAPFTFYIYLIPFFNINKIRHEIIEDIEGRKDD